MNRIEIEIELNEGRARILRELSAMTEEELNRPRTASEHDEGKTWSYADHFIHTTLIERRWNNMFRNHIAGKQGMPQSLDTGSDEARAKMMAGVHSWTEAWADTHRGKTLLELANVGLATRAETLKLLSELTDEQLESVIPGAPWADGTVGGIMARNSGHGDMHFGYARDGELAK